MNIFYLNFKLIKQFSKYISFVKIFNLIKLRFFYFTKNISSFENQNLSPAFISIELSNYCNLKCPECPVGTRNNTDQKKLNFEFELFRKLVDELKPKLFHSILYFQGEPFLNPIWSEFINYAHKSRIFTSTSTNGLMISKFNAEKIITSGLDKLIVSIDGATQEIYQKYRIGGKLDKVIEGVEWINYWKEKYKSATPLIEIQCIVFKDNEHQLKEMKLLARKLKANKLTFKSAQLYNFENGNARMTKLKNYNRYKLTNNGKYILKGKQSNKCWRMWSGAVINVKGEVLPCCFDKESSYTFGNIYDYTFTECWKTKNASGFRKKIFENRKQFEICRNCTSK